MVTQMKCPKCQGKMEDGSASQYPYMMKDAEIDIMRWDPETEKSVSVGKRRSLAMGTRYKCRNCGHRE